MFPGHARHPDGGARALDVHEAVVKEVEVVHGREGVGGVLAGGGGEVRFGVRGCDDGEVCEDRGGWGFSVWGELGDGREEGIWGQNREGVIVASDDQTDGIGR